jgi:hypothetical protein
MSLPHLIQVVIVGFNFFVLPISIFAFLTFSEILAEYWIVSAVTLQPKAGASLNFAVDHASGVRCPRSWRWVPALVEAGKYGMVSPRCREALAAKYSLS